MTLTKRELIMKVADKLDMTQNDVARVVERSFAVISQALAEGERWELRDFGVFEVKYRASRLGRNPRTGDQVPVPERRVVTFRPGKKMKEYIANEVPPASGEKGKEPLVRPKPESSNAPNRDHDDKPPM